MKQTSRQQGFTSESKLMDKQSPHKNRRNFQNTAVVALLPILLYFIEGPLSVYTANSQDFTFTPGDFFWILLGMGILLWLLLSVMGMLLPGKIGTLFRTLLFAAGLLSYLQDMFMNVKLSEVDGSRLNWEELAGYTKSNALVWTFVTLLLLILYHVLQKKKAALWEKLMLGISGFLAAMQVVVIVSMLASVLLPAAEEKNAQIYALSGDAQFQLGKEKNVIVFVLDSFGAKQLNSALERNPDFLEGFEDFTIYDNADSCYLYTYPSMSYMLTGVPLDVTCPAQAYLANAWSQDATADYYEGLKQAGYPVYLYSTGGAAVYGDCSNLYGKIENAQPTVPIIDQKAVVIRMLKISIFKYVPYVVKPRFEVPSYMFQSLVSYEGMAPIACGNSVYYEALSREGLSLADQENRIIIQHLDGTHAPTELDAYGGYKEGASLEETQDGLFLILRDYIERLKELGIYDEAAILITADHGRWSLEAEGDDAQILYLVKMPGARQSALQVNHAPISHEDFRATLYALAGMDTKLYGPSIFDWKEGDERPRTLVHPFTRAEYPDVPGELCNVYDYYTYTGTGEDLRMKIQSEGPDQIVPRPPMR